MTNDRTGVGPGAVDWSVAGIAGAVSRGELTAGEVVDTALCRIAMSEPVHNAFITLDAEGARSQAERVDRRLAAGGAAGSLAGVPVGVKDVFDVAWLPTTAGSALFVGNVAGADGPAAAALRRAGAVIVGKTNMDEFAFGPNQEAFGRTNCPADPARYAGGSSAGSAAAVAAGCVPVALGSDAGGSVRYPASCCGVVGYKPSFDRFGVQGTIPELRSLDTLGFLGARVDDVVRVSAAFAGGELPDSVPAPPRFGVPRGWGEKCSAEVTTAVEGALRNIEAAGATLVDIPAIDEAAVFSALITVVGTEAAVSLDALVPHDRQTAIARPIQELLRQGRNQSAADYVRAHRYCQTLRTEVDASLAGVDALLTPATATVAKRWDDPTLHDWSIARFLPAFNLTGHPAVSVPITVDALPVGLQAVGRCGADNELLSLAVWLEQRV